jgi:hypothetical protein
LGESLDEERNQKSRGKEKSGAKEKEVAHSVPVKSGSVNFNLT